MAYVYNTQLLNSFFDKFVELLSASGTNKVVIYNASDVVLVECTFPNQNFIASRTPTVLQLIASNSSIAVADGTASKGAIFNGQGVKLVDFSVGSETVNPTAELKLNSVSIYKGGSVVVNSITISMN